MKKLDDMMMEVLESTEGDTFGTESDSEGDVDLENAPVQGVIGYVLTKISRKPVKQQAELYDALLSDVLELVQEMPQGRQKLKVCFAEFKKRNF
jgi:hypothetical protein